MAPSKKIVRYEKHSGEPIAVDDIVITPLNHALTVRWAGGGWIWNLPAAVMVDQDNMVRYLPIRDVTRLVQCTLLGLAAFCIGIGLMRGKAR